MARSNCQIPAHAASACGGRLSVLGRAADVAVRGRALWVLLHRWRGPGGLHQPGKSGIEIALTLVGWRLALAGRDDDDRRLDLGPHAIDTRPSLVDQTYSRQRLRVCGKNAVSHLGWTGDTPMQQQSCRSIWIALLLLWVYTPMVWASHTHGRQPAAQSTSQRRIPQPAPLGSTPFPEPLGRIPQPAPLGSGPQPHSGPSR
jgi:hypothetical protein